MSVTVYESTGIVHSVIAHLGDTRAMTSVVHLTQYDDTLPIIAVKLMNGAQPYKIPESATVSIRVGKPDKTGVYNPCLGVSSDYTTAYFAATEQMCAADGKAFAVVEIIDGGTASTGIFVIDIAENPVNDETVLSDSELGIVQGLVDQAESARDDAGKSASNAEKSATKAQASADKASDSATLAGQHKTDAESAKNSAEQFANKAEQEATTAEQARDTAEEYMEKAQASSAVSNSSYYIGDDGMLHLNFNSEGLGKNDIDQTLSELQSTIESLSETVTDQASEITELQGDVAKVPSMVYRQNLLVNGDFNCNQRGIATSASTTLDVRQYGLDNWYCYTTTSGHYARQTPLDDGGVQITLYGTTADFGQFFEYDGNSDDLTVVLGVINSNGGIDRRAFTFNNIKAMSSSSKYDKAFYNGDVTQDNQWYLTLYRVERTGVFTGYSISLHITAGAERSMKLAYIDVFEGAEASSHQAEPYPVALLRCQRWLYAIGSGTPMYAMKWWQSSNADTLVVSVTTPTIMRTNPVLIAQSRSPIYEVNTGTIWQNDLNNPGIVQHGNFVSLKFTKTSGDIFDKSSDYFINVNSKTYLSCELDVTSASV